MRSSRARSAAAVAGDRFERCTARRYPSTTAAGGTLQLTGATVALGANTLTVDTVGTVDLPRTMTADAATNYRLVKSNSGKLIVGGSADNTNLSIQVNAGTLDGNPAYIAACLAGFCPAPAPTALPRITSPISSALIPLFLISSLITTAASLAAEISLNS